MSNNIEERLYKCFEKVFDEKNGMLNLKLNHSNIVFDLAGFECAEEFIDEMYEKWLETHVDKGEQYE